MNYTVHYIELPDGVHGAVTLNGDGTYLIIINNKLSECDRELTLQHELAHIKLDHFNRHDKTVTECEAEVDEYLKSRLISAEA